MSPENSGKIGCDGQKDNPSDSYMGSVFRFRRRVDGIQQSLSSTNKNTSIPNTSSKLHLYVDPLKPYIVDRPICLASILFLHLTHLATFIGRSYEYAGPKRFDPVDATIHRVWFVCFPNVYCFRR